MTSVANRPVAALMSKRLLHVTPDTPLRDAMARMREHRVSSIIVTDAGHPAGILTERDLLRSLPTLTSHMDQPCARFMHSPVQTISADSGYLEAYHRMLERNIRHLVVVDDTGSVAGMLSESDIVQELGLEYFIQFKNVGSMMSTRLCCLSPVVTLADAAACMDRDGHSCAIITDGNHKPLGILTERDVVRVGLEFPNPNLLTLQQVMTSPVATTTEQTALPEAMAQMNNHGIRRLVVLDDNDRVCGLLGYRDITRGLESRYVTFLREAMERQARELRQQGGNFNGADFLYHVLNASGTTALVAADLEQRIQFANNAAVELLGRPDDSLIGQPLQHLFHTEQAEHQLALTLDALTLSGHYRYEIPLQSAVGLRHLELQWSLLRGDDGQAQGYLLLAHDVTGRYRAEAALHESEDRFRAIFNSLNDAIFVHALDDGRVVDVNQRTCEMYGYSMAELLRLTVEQLSAGTPPYTQQDALHYLQQTARGQPQTFEWLARRQDGQLFWVEVTMRRARIGRDDRIVVSVRDIGDRKRSETELRRLNWALSALSRGNAALVHAESTQELFDASCKAITDLDVYALAYVGMINDNPEKMVEIVSAAGSAIGYLDGFQVSWGDNPLGHGPVGRAIRNNVSVVYNDVLRESSFSPWRERSIQHGLASIIAIPLRSHGKVIGVLAIYGNVPDAFGSDEVRLFEELAGDLGFGIDTLKTRSAYEMSLEARERYANKLRDTLEQAIGALAATLEKRDPYTAGHERRVADLAVAIGRELGFNDNQLHGLRLAGYIHDIGKVQIPSELLSKPAKLTPVEFELIKVHAEAGYDILKDIDFPWPIADMVLQHHECLDGSGYPQGLQGDEMLPESKILAVADIVEAMSSHRPYRPALGVAPALEQIEKLRGSKLDPAAVDACLRLFREKGYQFPE